MVKQAISVTLRPENLLWLRARVRASGGRSVSETLDLLINAARTGASAAGPPPASVVGRLWVDEADPLLEGADEAVRSLLAASTERSVRQLGRLRRSSGRSSGSSRHGARGKGADSRRG